MNNLMISEVQIACIIIMTVMTLFLCLPLPHENKLTKVYRKSRRLLTCGTLLIAVHFAIQYYLQKTVTHIGDIRTFVNLAFGIPISFFFDISYLNLQRKGKPTRTEWTLAPVLYVVTLLVGMGCLTTGGIDFFLKTGMPLAALLYAFMLIAYAMMMLRLHLRIHHTLRRDRFTEYAPKARYAHYTLLFMVVVAFGFPIMTFNQNLLLRSLYGILSITAAFLFCLYFLAYGWRFSPRTGGGPLAESRENRVAKSTEKVVLLYEGQEGAYVQPRKLQLEYKIKLFVSEESYLSSGVTLQQVADQLDVSPYRLKEWLQTTPYKKFNNWINFLRIEKAKQIMVREGKCNNTEIAGLCGFCDRKYFAYQFKKWTGMPPNEWLKHQSGSDNPAPGRSE